MSFLYLLNYIILHNFKTILLLFNYRYYSATIEKNHNPNPNPPEDPYTKNNQCLDELINLGTQKLVNV